MPTADTRDWKIVATLDYKCKVEPIQHTCTGCGGSGEVGGGFKSLDGPRPCDTCYGSGGYATYEHIEPKPPIPEALINHMRRAYQEYLALPKEGETNV